MAKCHYAYSIYNFGKIGRFYMNCFSSEAEIYEHIYT